MGVARASFQELLEDLEDFEDFLRQHGLRQWGKDEMSAIDVRQLAYGPYKSYKTYKTYLNEPEAAANCAICLINQVNFLLDRQITSLEKQFIKEGGYTEKLFWQRENEKKKRLVNLLRDKYVL